jgi:hypothetical protein
MRLALPCSIPAAAFIPAAAATAIPFIPFDPDILIDTEGNPIHVTTAGVSVTSSATGGGIFIFHNAVAAPASPR